MPKPQKFPDLLSPTELTNRSSHRSLSCPITAQLDGLEPPSLAFVWTMKGDGSSPITPPFTHGPIPCVNPLLLSPASSRQKTYRDFRLQGVLDGTLNNKSYENVYSRLTVEEATVVVKAGDGLQGITMRDSDEEEG